MPPPKSSKRGSNAAQSKPTTTTVSQQSAADPSTNPRKRKASTAALDGPADANSIAAPKAPLLQPRTRTLPQRTVSTWTPLPASDASRASISALLRAAQAPVLMTFPREARRREAQAVMTRLVGRLDAVLGKVPVPPLRDAGKAKRGRGEDERGGGIAYEELAERNEELQRELEPALRGCEELERELEKERDLLEADEKTLEEIRRNARGQERVRVEQGRAAPKLLRPPSTPQKVPDSADEIALAMDAVDLEARARARDYRPEHDREALPLTRQLQQHLVSMHSNASTLTEVTEWVQRSGAAVEEVLLSAGALGNGVVGV